VAEATTAQAYHALVRSRVAAQASYRASFGIELGTGLLVAGTWVTGVLLTR